MFSGLEDRQLARPAGHCSLCGQEIYGWERIYILDEAPVCPDCLEEYAKMEHRRDLWILDEWNRRYEPWI